MRRICSVLLALCLLLGGCSPAIRTTDKQFTATFLELFDTVTTVIGRAESEQAFQEKTQIIRQELEYYHKLFDIYNDYEGVRGIKAINDNAGIAPVQVEKPIIDLLLDCKHYYELTGGKVNVAMGSVLKLWHDARNDGIRDPMHAALPDENALLSAAQHMDFDVVQIDMEASTVFLSDPLTRLDVGAVAKGWATQKVAENAPSGMLISVGGNVCATGPKLADGTPWVVGVQDPDRSDKNVHTLKVTGGCVVTSGDYQRTYMVNGKYYHHIIDPETQMPASYWRSVTVLCEDSGLADALSTGLFLMDLEQGKALAEKCGADVLWLSHDGQEFMTDGFAGKLRN